MMFLSPLVDKVKLRGGTAMLTGGAVIDAIKGLAIKDWDIEVYGLSIADLENLLVGLGYKPDLVGKSFGVIKVMIDGIDVDISIPRRESKIGASHTDFKIELDHTMTTSEASKRRDLTINSIYQNLHTGEFVDHYNGIADLECGIIRHVDDVTFVEDPLRVLRIMQILPRKGKAVHQSTVELSRSISDQFDTLPKERVFEEFSKLLLKSKNPSRGIAFLDDCGWLIHFPQLKVGNGVFNVMDGAASILDSVKDEWKLPFMFCSMFDLSDHEVSDQPERFVSSLTTDKGLIKDTSALWFVLRGLMAGHTYGISDYKLRVLHNRFDLTVAARLFDCFIGESGDGFTASVMTFGSSLGPSPIQPIVMGRDLIDLYGLSPSKLFGEILRFAYELQMQGYEKEFIIASITTRFQLG